MDLKKLLLVIPVVLILAFSANADTASVYFNGGYAFGNHGYGVPPYQGTLNGNSAEFFCVDFSHDITGNTGWTATVTNLNGASFSSTFQGGQANYQAFVYLISEMMGTSNLTQKAEYQWAIWSLSGGGDPYGTDASLWKAALGYVSQNPTYALHQGWEILTPTGRYGQEFLVQTPEPPSGFLVGFGVLGLLGMALKKLIV